MHTDQVTTGVNLSDNSESKLFTANMTEAGRHQGT